MATTLRRGRHPVALALLALLAAAAIADGAELRRIAISGRDQTIVRLYLSAPVAVRSQAVPLQAGGADRILVDLDGTTLATSARGVVMGRGALLRVLPDQLNAKTVRLTLELTTPVGFAVQTVGNDVTVTLADDRPARVDPPAVPRVDQPARPRP
jgi:hypothetical protein